MGFFGSDAEKARKSALKALEDKRLAFAQRARAAGALPGKMLFASTDDGGFAGVGQTRRGVALIKGPGPGGEGDFQLIPCPEGAPARLQPVSVKGEGMGGMLGFGKKGYSGFNLTLEAPDGETVTLPLLAGYSSLRAESDGEKCPLFSPKRRRGDANFVWEFQPATREQVEKLCREWLIILEQ